MDNLCLAHKNAKKGKSHYREVKMVEENPEFYLKQIQDSLLNQTFTTSDYKIDEILDKNKKRTIHKLPYFPDRIIQHALIQIIEPILLNSLIRDTFQSIKGRGIHDARKRVFRTLKKNKPKYCLKMDIKKYYPSVDNELLKEKIRKKIKCPKTLWLIDNIIDSVQGLPIGNYTSQIFGNYYLSDFDWYIKHQGLMYFRYCDDLIVLNDDKEFLHELKISIIRYLEQLKLIIKPNYQVFDINKQGIDFVGYIYKNNTMYLRKSILINFKRTIKSIDFTQLTERDISSIFGFWGWFKVILNKTAWRSAW